MATASHGKFRLVFADKSHRSRDMAGFLGSKHAVRIQDCGFVPITWMNQEVLENQRDVQSKDPRAYE